ncbi:hypothetical protein AXG93_3515s1030 [Marchantia polymorpha subsp. ruderalis]|uniref:Uncharacterized protein n=1 Tax=Marchantia polymorpha subsp. ruderalis TaxID=1480154 RepID=A0A176WHR0_MARPO|nr:hypothetical protein AXG93_3515s1030 [Marchantia polymorpha subsp. ruderalis]
MVRSLECMLENVSAALGDDVILAKSSKTSRIWGHATLFHVQRVCVHDMAIPRSPYQYGQLAQGLAPPTMKCLKAMPYDILKQLIVATMKENAASTVQYVVKKLDMLSHPSPHISIYTWVSSANMFPSNKSSGQFLSRSHDVAATQNIRAKSIPKSVSSKAKNNGDLSTEVAICITTLDDMSASTTDDVKTSVLTPVALGGAGLIDELLPSSDNKKDLGSLAWRTLTPLRVQLHSRTTWL